MDAGSGAVLYGKNIHTAYFPASITKILTALIVIENCDMDDIVTFSRNAVHNVEPGSTSAGMDVGDQLTVRDCLYAWFSALPMKWPMPRRAHCRFHRSLC